MFQKRSDRRLIAIAAGKGGVGKSTVAVNLALALREQGYAVGLLDADLYGPSVRKMLPEEKRPGQKGDRIIPAVSRGITIMTMAYFTQEATVVRAPIANKLIAQFVNQVDWGELDYLIIDYPPGTGDIQLTLSQELPLTGAILVTTPQEVAVMDVFKAAHLFKQVSVPIIGVVENMSYFQNGENKVFIFGEGGGRELSTRLSVPILGVLPIDPVMSRLGDGKGTLFEVEEGEALQNHFKDIAKKIMSRISEMPKKMPVKQIEWIDKHHLRIAWADGTEMKYRLSDLQKRCPCAGCQEPQHVEYDVEARNVQNIGHYAIQIEFDSGCSQGIYEFSMLRQYGRELNT